MIRREAYPGEDPGSIEKAAILFSIYDGVGNAQSGDKVYACINERYALYGKNVIQREREEFCIDDNGLVEMRLIETDTLTADTGRDIYWNISMPKNGFSVDKKIPKGTLNANLFDLPDK